MPELAWELVLDIICEAFTDNANKPTSGGAKIMCTENKLIFTAFHLTF